LSPLLARAMLVRVHFVTRFVTGWPFGGSREKKTRNRF
jgi:hypothetical protein